MLVLLYYKKGITDRTTTCNSGKCEYVLFPLLLLLWLLRYYFFDAARLMLCITVPFSHSRGASCKLIPDPGLICSPNPQAPIEHLKEPETPLEP